MSFAREVWWLLHVVGGVALRRGLEFAIDQVLRTRLQESLVDTMSDLMFGVCGVALYLGYTAFTRSRD